MLQLLVQFLKFNYNVKIQPWLDEGISQDILNKSIIGFYPGGD